jgi:hypothetical protein
MTTSCRRDHITPTLRDTLHLLPSHSASRTRSSDGFRLRPRRLSCLHPGHLSTSVDCHLLSADHGDLVVPRTTGKRSTDLAVFVLLHPLPVPGTIYLCKFTTWNHLPVHIHYLELSTCANSLQRHQPRTIHARIGDVSV